ncbi:DNA/RNA non-specific endonuclease [Chitinophaga sp. YR573]|uniref:DNA/RNA non-specific endonuclease n=1 Tax=Chitinophaga sp. YR573 TaxID=1881040 RepID=UPI0008C1B5E8|nr:DNA/RNA non-specific endonuclease [Chitinophaga sp. YR573]SEV90933.1 DNA/RNA non-specific endonuclease [Chitinophaga sp. YR573]
MKNNRVENTPSTTSKAVANTISPIGNGVSMPAVQLKLSLKGQAINTYAGSKDDIFFNREELSATIDEIAKSLGQPDASTIIPIIDKMGADHLTHVFSGKVSEQQDALASFLGYALNTGEIPANYADVKTFKQHIKPAESYKLIGAVRYDRPEGLANVDELSLTKSAASEEDFLGGFYTQVLNIKQTDQQPEVADEAKKTDKESIEKGVRIRVPGNYKGKPGSHAAAFGLGGKIEGTAKKLRSYIRWDPAVKNEGTHMIADPLGPDHPLGSTPGGGKTSEWNKARVRMEALSRKQSDYVAGHLLNEQLGGPGTDVRNLAPITSEANANHKQHVEAEVKKMVNKDLKWIFYEVKTERKPLDNTKKKNYDPSVWDDGNYTTSFDCNWGELDEDGNRLKNNNLKLTFTDPTAITKAATNTAVGHKTVTPIAAGNVAKTTKELTHVILNTTIKTRSYLIAAQTLLPEYQKMKDKVAEQEKEVGQQKVELGALYNAISHYKINVDVLSDKEDEKMEAAYDELEGAIQSETDMDAIFNQDISQVAAYSTLKALHTGIISLAVNTAKGDAISAIKNIKKSFDHTPGAPIHPALEQLINLIDQTRHPIEDVVEKQLHKFELEHDKMLAKKLLAADEEIEQRKKEQEDLQEKNRQLEEQHIVLNERQINDAQRINSLEETNAEQQEQLRASELEIAKLKAQLLTSSQQQQLPSYHPPQSTSGYIPRGSSNDRRREQPRFRERESQSYRPSRDLRIPRDSSDEERREQPRFRERESQSYRPSQNQHRPHGSSDDRRREQPRFREWEPQPYRPSQNQHRPHGSSDDRRREQPRFQEREPEPYRLPQNQHRAHGSSHGTKRERPVFQGPQQSSSHPQNVTPSRFEYHKRARKEPSGNISEQQQYPSESGGYADLPPELQHLPIASTSFSFQPPEAYGGSRQYPPPFSFNINFNPQQPPVIDPQEQRRAVANSIWQAACNLFNETYRNYPDLQHALFRLNDPMARFRAFPNDTDYATISEIFVLLKNWPALEAVATQWEKEWNNLKR